MICLELLSLKIHPQEDMFPLVEPSVLHLTQFGEGGCQITSMIFGALGGWRMTLNFFSITKFDMLGDATDFDRFPDSAVLEIIVAIDVF